MEIECEERHNEYDMNVWLYDWCQKIAYHRFYDYFEKYTWFPMHQSMERGNCHIRQQLEPPNLSSITQTILFLGLLAQFWFVKIN